MRRIIRWAIDNPPGVNTLVIAICLLGLVCLFSLRRETFPEFELEVILVSVPYPGADPQEVETAICQKVEEAVGAIAGIKEITSVAQESAGFVVLQVDPDVPSVEEVLNEVRSEVDRISTFPELAEDAEVKQITFREIAIRLAILGPKSMAPDARMRLRMMTERVRENVLQLPTVTQADIQGARPFQIDVEIPRSTLRRYGLDLRQVADAIRRENVDLPAGTLETPSQDVRLKGQNKRVRGEAIGEIPLITDPNGVVLTIDDVAEVTDGFSDTVSMTWINNRPALVIAVKKTSDEDLIEVTDAVKQFASTQSLPPGYDLLTWDDRSTAVKDRINLLAENGMLGLVFVFLILALFLDLRLAFWVACGIPISFLGSCIILLMTGQTLNMLSLFGFLMVIGILVDDGIVIGENIHAHREQGLGPRSAALDGTLQVFPSVFSSVVTTIIAFMPLLFIAGIMGKFVSVLPGAAIACLAVSLIEGTLVLPVHLRHDESTGSLVARARAVARRMAPLWRWTIGLVLVGLAAGVWILWLAVAPLASLLRRLSPFFRGILDWFTNRLYAPTLRRVIRHPGLTITVAIAILLLAAGVYRGGIVKWNFFPKIDVPRIQATITYPAGTPERITKEAVFQLHAALTRVNERLGKSGPEPVDLVQDSVGQLSGVGSSGRRTQSSGSHLGRVTAELIGTSKRSRESSVIVNMWREEAGTFPGAESLVFNSPAFGPAGRAIEFKLLAPKEHADDLAVAVEHVKELLGSYQGVYDVRDDSRPGKAEIEIDLKPDAVALGVQRADLFETIRAAYYGEEVMRVQRGRHEVKIMVRLPEEQRHNFADLYNLRIRTQDPATGELVWRPILQLAELSVGRGPSEINRINRLRSITVSCAVDESLASAAAIVQDLRGGAAMPEWVRAAQDGLGPQGEPAAPQKSLQTVLQEFPNVRVLWKGQQQQQAESFQSMKIGMICAILGMFALLTIEFKSYLQPLLILMIIPFGIVGAIAGHWLLGLPVSFFSVMGLVALSGVVVNDSIVMVDFINIKLGEGLPLNEALHEAGLRRMRPVFLTSATTMAGLAPMVFETSFQAQLVVPMAAAICFGLMMTTALILLLLPAVYAAYGGLVGMKPAWGASHGEPSDKSPEKLTVNS